MHHVSKEGICGIIIKMAHNKDNTFLSEARLTTLIRETHREEFKRQQKNLIISDNLEITMKEI